MNESKVAAATRVRMCLSSRGSIRLPFFVRSYNSGLKLFVTLVIGVLTYASGAVQPAFDVKELAAYRLTTPIFKKFETATHGIADVMQNDPAFAETPLFTREISVSGDAPLMATELEARLRSHPALAHALRTAKITAREYTRFALALLAARLAHGFVDAGVLRTVPAGVAADNVAFVEEHQIKIAAVVKALGISN